MSSKGIRSARGRMVAEKEHEIADSGFGKSKRAKITAQIKAEKQAEIDRLASARLESDKKEKQRRLEMMQATARALVSNDFMDDYATAMVDFASTPDWPSGASLSEVISNDNLVTGAERVEINSSYRALVNSYEDTLRTARSVPPLDSGCVQEYVHSYQELVSFIGRNPVWDSAPDVTIQVDCAELRRVFAAVYASRTRLLSSISDAATGRAAAVDPRAPTTVDSHRRRQDANIGTSAPGPVRELMTQIQNRYGAADYMRYIQGSDHTRHVVSTVPMANGRDMGDSRSGYRVLSVDYERLVNFRDTAAYAPEFVREILDSTPPTLRNLEVIVAGGAVETEQDVMRRSYNFAVRAPVTSVIAQGVGSPLAILALASTQICNDNRARLASYMRAHMAPGESFVRATVMLVGGSSYYVVDTSVSNQAGMITVVNSEITQTKHRASYDTQAGKYASVIDWMLSRERSSS